MKTIIKHSCFLFLLVFCSCNSWIDITPSDRLSEDMLFEDRQGFGKAINGVYVGLVDRSLYGRNMSAGVIDLMGQLYYYGIGTDFNSLIGAYNYEDEDVKAVFEAVWEKAYALIVNCNIIIEKCDEKREVLPDVYYGLYKGEAFALRAMLHLDLLRLFGPVYDESTKTEKCIPYVTNSDTEISPMLSAEEILNLVITDLKASLELLKDSDPIFTEGVRNEANADGDNSLNYRQYRLNYYAVKTLLARAYLWGHDKTNALTVAEEILKEVQVEGAEIFPFVIKEAASSDRMFSSEVMFALYDSYRGDQVYDELFIPTLETSKLYTLPGDALPVTDPNGDNTYDDQNDYRFKMWTTNTDGGKTVPYCKKYEDVTGSGSEKFNKMIPLIRLSEAYFIAAECVGDIDRAKNYLNKIRTNRNCVSLNPTEGTLMNYIAKEFRREFLGEGQMFFFYKRNGMTKIPNGRGSEESKGTINMTTSNYVVPLPDSETSVRLDN